MLITKEVEVSWNRTTCTHFKKLGYKFTHIGDKFIVKVEHLPKGSTTIIEVQCINCNKIKKLKYYNYLININNNIDYYCQKCVTKLFSKNKTSKTKLKKSKSFKQWCIENNRQDILDRWDYKLNICKPNEITYGTNEKYYFKCPRNIHKSEFRQISQITIDSKLTCNLCNSFGQYLIDEFGNNALKVYWNDKNILNPFKISKCSAKKVLINCIDVEYHNYYEISCANFVNGRRCKYCNSKKIHHLDSLGELLNKNNLFHLWSDKNNLSPYNYPKNGVQEVWFKCNNEIHDDYCRRIDNSNAYNFRCPYCNNSKGEKKIEIYFKTKNIEYQYQKSYEDLLGVGNGLLRYDFYLPDYNLLIEYQGQFHDGNVGFKAQSKSELEYQQEHDKRKREYAQTNNINLLEIWYWDFDNIESILEQELSKMCRTSIVQCSTKDMITTL